MPLLLLGGGWRLSLEGGRPREAARPPRPPNIIIFVSDDQGWKDIGYHQSDILTPHLDQLAQAGVRLESHYVFPTCSPTRVALLTGRNPSRFGVLGPIAGRSEQALPPHTATLAGVLKARGYATALIGKWHLGLSPEVGPRRYGFDFTYGYLHGQIDQYTHRYKNGDRTWHRNDQFVEEEGHATDLIAAQAMRFIATKREAPFFLYVAFSVPHTPLQEEARWTSLYEGRIAEPSRRLFAASVTHMDDAIGRILAALERTGKRQNSLILFTSDNGGQRNYRSETDYEGKHGPYPVLGDNRPLRGWKGDLYEGGVRVPALVHWQGVLKPKVVHQAVSAMDWLPTLARLAGAKTSPALRLEGQDIWSLLSGDAPATPRTLYWRTSRQFALRHGDWKFVENRGDPVAHELFHLTEDPNEERNLAPQLSERVKQMRKLLEQQKRRDP